MQHPQQFSNAPGSANYAASYDPDHPIAFTAVEGPVKEEAFWPFGPTDEPNDTSGPFGSFGGLSGEETGGSAFMIEEGPVQELALRDRIVGILAAITRALVTIAMFHYLWLSFGNSLYARMVSTNTNG